MSRTSRRCSRTTVRGVRGDLAAVVTAILMHPEAMSTTATSGKLSEPVLFVVSQLRALNATVTDHPFMSDKAEAMGQKVFYPAVGLQLLLAGLPGARHRAPGGGTSWRPRVPDPDDGHGAGAGELRRRAARRLVRHRRRRRLHAVHEHGHAIRRRSWTTAACSSWAAGCRPRTRTEIIAAVRVTPASNHDRARAHGALPDARPPRSPRWTARSSTRGAHTVSQKPS